MSSTFNSTSNPVYLVMQSPKSEDMGYNAQGTSTYNVAQLPFNPTTDFHEYRFDWINNKVSFYADGMWLHDENYQYTPSNGSLFLSHWSNGNLLWSRGPPQSRAVMTISYVKAYFNSSDPSRQSQFNKECAGHDDICQIPEQSVRPDVNSMTFFHHGMCGEDTSRPTSSAALTSTSTTHTTSSTPSASSRDDSFIMTPEGSDAAHAKNIFYCSVKSPIRCLGTLLALGAWLCASRGI